MCTKKRKQNFLIIHPLFHGIYAFTSVAVVTLSLFDSSHKLKEALSGSVFFFCQFLLRLKNLVRDWNWNLKLLLQ